MTKKTKTAQSTPEVTADQKARAELKGYCACISCERETLDRIVVERDHYRDYFVEVLDCLEQNVEDPRYHSYRNHQRGPERTDPVSHTDAQKKVTELMSALYGVRNTFYVDCKIPDNGKEVWHYIPKTQSLLENIRELIDEAERTAKENS